MSIKKQQTNKTTTCKKNNKKNIKTLKKKKKKTFVCFLYMRSYSFSRSQRRGIVGAGGVLVPPEGYIEGVRALCNKYLGVGLGGFWSLVFLNCSCFFFVCFFFLQWFYWLYVFFFFWGGVGRWVGCFFVGGSNSFFLVLV